MLNKASRIVLDTLLPSAADPTLKYGLFDAGFDAFWSDFERATLPALRWGFRPAVFVATWVAPLLILRPPPMTLHDRPTRERVLAAMGAVRTRLSLG